MAIHNIDFADVPQLSSRDKAYQSEQNPFKDLIAYTPDIKSFEKAIADRQSFAVDRAALTSVLHEQYDGLHNAEASIKNIDLLNQSNTYTVITAHQPVLFTGPLYYIIKIFSAINMAERLKQEHPNYNFVPVFISGGEDHDFDEVNKCNLFGKTITWHQDKGGSVGRMSLDGVQDAIKTFNEILGDRENAERAKSWVQSAYEASSTYAEFTHHLVHSIFGQYGLVALNPDHHKLKRLFIPAMEKEICTQASKPLVEQTQAQIEALGYKTQAFARPINLFYLSDGQRERIEEENGAFNVLNTDLSFTKEEILAELNQHPERFSPNVVMRPLYQETILPNLAYIGGGGELAYWIERKSQFREFGVFFPILIRRASAMILPKGISKNMGKLDIGVNDIFNDTDALISNLVESATDVDLNLEDQVSQVNSIFELIAKKATQLDPTLAKSVLAEGTKQVKVIEQLESRLRRTVKSQQDTQVNKIKNIKSKLFPNNGLQERHDNFFQYYDMMGQDLLDLLKESIDALEKSFVVIEM